MTYNLVPKRSLVCDLPHIQPRSHTLSVSWKRRNPGDEFASNLYQAFISFQLYRYKFISLSDQTELLAQLNALPVRVDTLRVKTMKAELERKLSEIESAIKIFSRPKVFVKVDE